MILVIDNYDSFTFNLVQYFQELGRTVVVKRNDQVSLRQIVGLNPWAVVISPGPGGPEDAGISIDAIANLGHRFPILGVCLGHQAIAAAFGGRVVRAGRLMHGKTSPVFTKPSPLFSGMDNPFQAGRYHSLMVEEKTLPDCLEVTAFTDQAEIMGIAHKEFPIYGLQFHPESILTPGGKRILGNFLDIAELFHLRPRYAANRPLPAPQAKQMTAL